MGEIAEWGFNLRHLSQRDPNIDEDNRVVRLVVLPRRDQVRLPAAPPDTTLVLDATSLNRPGIALIFDEQPYPLVELDTAPSLSEVSITASDRRRLGLTIRRTPDASRLKVKGAPGRLNLEGGRFILEGSASVLEAGLHEADVEIGRGRLDLNRLRMSGKVEVSGNAIKADRTKVDGDIEIACNQAVSLGFVESPEDAPVRVSAAARLAVEAMPPRSVVVIQPPHGVTLGPGPVQSPRPSFRDLRIETATEVSIGDVALDGLSLPEESAWPPQVKLESGADVRGVTGHIRELWCAPGTVFAGSLSNPPRIHAIGNVEESEIENVDVYGVSTADLDALAKCQRFAPSVPRRPLTLTALRNRHPSRTREDEQLGGSDDELALQRRAHYWAKMVSILKESHAPGATQAEARYALARARREIAMGTERRLLESYWFVGYGERIARPVTLFLVLAVAVSWVFMDPNGTIGCCSRIGEWAAATWRTILSPLAFFRFGTKPKADGLLEPSLLLFAQAGGVVALFFSLTAVRRLAKAE